MDRQILNISWQKTQQFVRRIEFHGAKTILNPTMGAFVKFGVLSGGGWLLDCGLLLLLSQRFGIALPIANFISSSTAALTVFTISRFLVFRLSRERPFLRTFIYFAYTCGIIVAASAVIGPIAGFLHRSAEHLLLMLTAGQTAFFAKVMVTPPQLLANFFMSRYLSEYKTPK